MQNFQERVRSVMNEQEVLVAISTREASILDGVEAKRVFRQFQMVILNSNQATLYRDFVGSHPRSFVYGVTSRMKADEAYLSGFLKSCGDGTNITEIIGMTMNGD